MDITILDIDLAAHYVVAVFDVGGRNQMGRIFHPADDAGQLIDLNDAEAVASFLRAYGERYYGNQERKAHPLLGKMI